MFEAGIQTKFILILAMAAVAPIVMGVLSIRFFGIRHYEQGQGQLFQATAEYLADELALLVRHEADGLRHWAQDLDLADSLPDDGGTRPLAEPDQRQAAETDREWVDLNAGDPKVAAVLHHPIADQMRRFRVAHPRFEELLVTDRHGRVVASTNKTTDYWQADETWWTQAATLRRGTIWAEGIHLDQSAGVYSIDLSLALYRDRESLDRPVGVLKGVVHALPLISSLRPELPMSRPSTLVVLSDGRVLARLYERAVIPLQESLPPNVVESVLVSTTGWRVARMGSAAEQHLFGYAQLRLTSAGPPVVQDGSGTPMFVVVHRSRALVNAPITLQAVLLYFSGAILVVLFMLAGLYIAEQKIVGPLRTLQTAAQAIASSAGLNRASADGAHRPPTAARREAAEAMAARVAAIRTGDELEALARDFSLMADRVLRYHEELETEIAMRVEEIENDQRVAREFQQALLPSSYPDIPERGLPGAVRLRFDHVYEPTLAVGGDFFHVAKVSPHRVRVFLADVMGHGARSALITAILRTLLEDLAPYSKDPGDLLRLMNRRFCASLPRQDECIFATACALVIDAKEGRLEYASAGHPPPVHLIGEADHAEFLPAPDGPRAAIGIFEGSEYGCLVRPFQPGDALLLYTDGLDEATNPAGEEFGPDRLLRALHPLVGHPARELTRGVMAALKQFTWSALEQDDVCLIAIEAQSMATRVPMGLAHERVT